MVGRRTFVLASALAATGCASTDAGNPEITGIRPEVRVEDTDLRVEILGANFTPTLTIDPAGNAQVDARFEASVTVPDRADPVPLKDVRFKSHSALTATIPSGLPPGRFDLQVTTPTGLVVEEGGIFLNQLAPVILSVDPDNGPLIGGGKVRIHGRYFVRGATAGLGPGCPTGDPTPLTGPERESDELFSGLRPPAEFPGPTDVWVTTEHGTGCLKAAFTYLTPAVPPEPLSIEPVLGPTDGGTHVTIAVGNLAADATARVGGKALTARAIDLDRGLITGVTQRHDPGLVNVVVEVPGVGGKILTEAFEYVAKPSIDSVVPPEGPQTGGTTVLIRGEGFVGDDLSVSFDGALGQDLSVDNSGRTLRVVTPAGRGEAQITISGIGGVGERAAGFAYRPPPVVLSVDPTEGRASGSEQLIIRGAHLDAPGILVTVGGRLLAGQQILGPDQIVGLTPAGSGTVAVAVAGPDGAAFSLDAFTYHPRPEVFVVRPRHGRTGDEVEIRGRGFLPDTTVLLGLNPLISLRVHSPEHITGFVPDGQGLVTLEAEHAFGVSDPVPDAFQYESDENIPQVVSIHPSRGPEAGGNRFWIAGASFPDEVTVRFGNATVEDAEAIDGQVITGTVPAGNGDRRATDVVVQAGGVTPRLGSAYVYGSADRLRVDSFHPAQAPEAGGVGVVVRGGGFDAQTRILIGGRPLRRTRLIHDGELRGQLPPGAGVVDVVGFQPGDPGAGAILPDAVRFLAADEQGISALVPDAIPVAGGVVVEVHGVGLGGVTRVRFGDREGVDVEVVDAGHVRARAPEGVAGTATVSLCEGALCADALVWAEGLTYLGPHDAPRISAIIPSTGHPAGGQVISILGGPFPEDPELLWNDGEPIESVYVGPGQITATVPAGSGDADVVLRLGTHFVRSVRGFRYVGDAPTLASVDPASASARGSDGVLTVQGDHFVTGETRVFVGDVELDDVEVDASGAALIGILPPSPPGTFTLRVETPAGEGELPVGFVVEPAVDDLPELLAIHPSEGPSEGGAPVILRGVHLDETVAGALGGAPLERIRVLDSATLLALTTAGPVGGNVPVEVSIAGGATAQLPTAFAFRPTPEIASVQESPSARVGGQRVVVSFLRGMTADTVVTVDGLVLSDPRPDVAGSAFIGDLPPGTAGRRDVRAENEWGVDVLPEAVSYLAPPIIDRIEPATGLLGGGSSVAILGSGFDDTTVARFGARPLLHARLIDPGRLQGTLPPGFGVIDVQVEGEFGRSTLLDAFSYLAAPRIAGVTPYMGPVSGGTTISVRGAGLGAETRFTVGGVALGSVDAQLPIVRSTELAVGVTPPTDDAGWQPVSLLDHRGDDDEAQGFRYIEDLAILSGEGLLPAVPVRGIASHQVTGVLWVATDEGLHKLDPRTDQSTDSRSTPYALPSDRVTGVVIEAGGGMVVTTDEGAAVCTTGAQLQCRHVDGRDIIGDVPSVAMSSVDLLADGAAILGGEAGLVLLHPDGREEPFLFGFAEDRVPGSVVRDTAVGPDGRGWLATDRGVALFDASARAFTTIDQTSTGGGLGDDDTHAIEVDPDGVVWVGTSTGLFRFDPELEAGGWSEIAELSGATIRALDATPVGDLWVGGDDGLARVAGTPPVVVDRRTADDGLPVDQILAVHGGARGGVWVGTAAGLVRHAGP